MLAPHWRKIGFGLAGISVISLIGLQYFFKLNQYSQVPAKVAFILIAIGLFIPIITREKQEDELMKHVRHNALARTFFIGIVGYIVSVLGDIIFNIQQPDLATFLIFMQLSIYHLYFYQLKKDIAKDKPELF